MSLNNIQSLIFLILDERQESRQRLVTAWQNYCETGDHLDPSSPIKRTVRIPSVDDEDVLPLPDGAFTTNIGLDMVVVVTKVCIVFQQLETAFEKQELSVPSEIYLLFEVEVEAI